jgi:hypothetical protein
MAISMRINRAAIAIRRGAIIRAGIVVVIPPTGRIVISAAVWIISPMAVIGAHKAQAYRAVSRGAVAIAPVISVVRAGAEKKGPDGSGDQRKK